MRKEVIPTATLTAVAVALSVAVAAAITAAVITSTTNTVPSLPTKTFSSSTNSNCFVIPVKTVANVPSNHLRILSLKMTHWILYP